MPRCQSPQLLQQIKSTVNNLGADLFSPWIDTLQMDYVSWEIIVGAGATGAITFQGSNQYDPITNSSPPLIAAPASTPAPTALAGSAVNQIVTTPGLGAGQGAARWQRMKYTFTSGNGVLNLWVTGSAKE